METDDYLSVEDKPDQTSPSDTKSTRSHIRGSSLLFAGRLISLGLKFFLQVLIVRYLSKADYGAFAYAINFIEIGAILSLFSLDKSVSRFVPIYDEHGDYASLAGIIVLSLATILGIGAAIIAVTLGFRGLIEQHIVTDSLTVSLLLIVIALAPLQALDAWFVSIFAAFASVKEIFFRRYILGPGLQLLAVLVVILMQSNVYLLSWGYLIGGFLGVVAYTTMMTTLFRQKNLFPYFNRQAIRLPARELLGFSAPLFFSNLVFVLRTQLVIVFLGFFRTAIEVAEYRAVVPLARLNQVVYDSFTFLYMPLAARFFARDDRAAITNLYWQTAVWISIISYPIFMLTFALSKPITVLMFGERYADSSMITALLALGYYFNAALGFNVHTLRVYGTMKYIILVDFIGMCVALALNVLLISSYGAIGAAISFSITLIVHNLLNHLGLALHTSITLFDWKYLSTYAMLAAGALFVWLVQLILDPALWIGLPLALLVSLGVLLANRRKLNIGETFPELHKLPMMKKLFP